MMSKPFLVIIKLGCFADTFNIFWKFTWVQKIWGPTKFETEYHNITVSQYKISQYLNITILRYHNITVSQYKISQYHDILLS